MKPDRALLATALGGRAPLAWEAMSEGGYTRSQAWRVATNEGPVVVKQAEDAGSLQMLRREAVVYQGVQGPFLPSFVGFAESDERALLAIELLEGAHWPPPYPADLAPLESALEAGGAPLPTPADAIPFVAAFAGHFAVEAAAPLPAWADPASTLREDMQGDLAHALRWLVELLDLPPLS